MIAGIVAGGRPVPPTAPPVGPPALGTYWADEGGYYAGMITYADARKFYIVVADVGATTSLQWKLANTATTGTDNMDDGVANQAAMLAASTSDHPAAAYCDGYAGDSHTDWYMAARNEMTLLAENLRPAAPGVHANFATGGPQAFTGGTLYYHSSSQAITNGVEYAWARRFSTTGAESTNGKNNARPIRPIRRVVAP